MVIFLNSVAMAAYDYTDRSNTTYRNQILEKSGKVFTGIFLLECVLKIIGMGLIIHKKSYLRDPWNWLDFIAALVGALEYDSRIPNLKVLRTFRVIRPLRSIKAFPSMRRLITSLLNSLTALANVIVFLFFIFLLFGILGIHLYQGRYYNVCRLTQYPDNTTMYWPIDFDSERLCKTDIDCGEGRYCGNPMTYDLTLKEDSDLRKYNLINYRITHFDHIGGAILTIFQIITLEGWAKMMYNLSDVGFNIVSPIYFCTLVMFGSFFLLNLNLAVIMNEFTKVDNQFKEEQAKAIMQMELEFVSQQIQYQEEQQKQQQLQEQLQQSEEQNEEVQQNISRRDVSQINQPTVSALQNLRRMNTSNIGKLLIPKADNKNQGNFVSDQSPLNCEKRGYDENSFDSSNQQISIIDKKFKIDDNKSQSQINEDNYQNHNQSINSQNQHHNISINSPQKNVDLTYRFQGQEFDNNQNSLLGASPLIFSKVKSHFPEPRRTSKLQAAIDLFKNKSNFPIGPDSKNNAGKLDKTTNLQIPQNRNQHNNDFMMWLKMKNNDQRKNSQSSLNFADIQQHDRISKLTNGRVSSISKELFSNGVRRLSNAESRQSASLLKNKRGSNASKTKRQNSLSKVSIKEESSPSSSSDEEVHEQEQSEQVEEVPQNNNMTKSELQRKQMEDKLIQRSKKNFVFRICYIISTNTIFSLLILCIILANTITLAMDKYPITDSETETYNQINEYFSMIFLAEMVLKIIGLGPKGYAADRFNLFDCLIVLSGLTDLILSEFELSKSVSTNGALTAFRAIRLLRVFKLARSWGSFQEMLIKIGKTIKDISNFLILLFIFIFIYAIMGMEILAYKVRFDEDDNPINVTGMNITQIINAGSPPRENFDNLISAITTIFISIIGDVFGKMILLNLFLAMLLKNFECYDQQQQIGIEEKLFDKIKKYISSFCKRFNKVNTLTTQQSFNGKKSDIFDSQKSLDQFQITLKQTKTMIMQSNINQTDFKNDPPDQGNLLESGVVDPSKTGTFIENPQTNFQSSNGLAQQIGLQQSDSIRKSTKRKSRSVYQQEIGNFCAKIIYHKLFDPFILILIFLTSIALALDNPLNDPYGELAQGLIIADLVFTTIFAVEFVLKVISLGFLLNGKNSYLLNGWNIIDLAILVLSFISILVEEIDMKFVKIIRMFRVLRPLRLVSRNQNLKIAVQSLLNSILGIFHVFVISFLFFLLFGIFGVNYFKGEFYYCDTEGLDDLGINDFNIITKFDCLNIGGIWRNSDHNFDNIFFAMKTLFEMATTEGWTDVMWLGIDSIGIDYEPVTSYNPYWALFFILFLLFGSLFVMNLFVGVVINTFNEEKERLSKNHILSFIQREWILIRIASMKIKPLKIREVKTKNKFRKFFVEFVNTFAFELVILICIILNTCCLAIEWYGQKEEVNFALDIINYVFAFIFTLELIAKIISQGFKNFFGYMWNFFDFIIVILTTISIILSFFSDQNLGSSTTLIRAFRIGRVLRLISKARFLKTIFNTFLNTIPSMGNIGGLLILLLYIFSILGIFLFSEIKLQSNLDRHANFQNFKNAFLTLIRCATGESWNYIMDDAARNKSIYFDCDSTFSYDAYVQNGYVTTGCGNPYTAFPFFFTFTLLVTLIFMNLFIAIILESFENVNISEDLKIKDDDLKLFQGIWVKFDPKGTGFIQIMKFDEFLLQLLNQQSKLIRSHDKLINNSLARREFIEELELPTYMKMSRYHYADVLCSLTKAMMQIDLMDPEDINQSSVISSEKSQGGGINLNMEIEQLEVVYENEKIKLVEDYQQLQQKINEQKYKYVDQFEGNIYTSRFVYLLPVMAQRIKFWLIRKRKQQQEQENSSKQQDLDNSSKQQEIKFVDLIRQSKEQKLVKTQEADEEAIPYDSYPQEFQDDDALQTEVKRPHEDQEIIIEPLNSDRNFSGRALIQPNANNEVQINRKFSHEKCESAVESSSRRYDSRISEDKERPAIQNMPTVPAVIFGWKQDESHSRKIKSSEEHKLSLSQNNNNNGQFNFYQPKEEFHKERKQTISPRAKKQKFQDKKSRSISSKMKKEKEYNDNSFTDNNLNVSFGISDNVIEDFPDVKIFGFNEEKKRNSDNYNSNKALTSNEEQKFTDDIPNEQDDSPKFINNNKELHFFQNAIKIKTHKQQPVNKRLKKKQVVMADPINDSRQNDMNQVQQLKDKAHKFRSVRNQDLIVDDFDIFRNVNKEQNSDNDMDSPLVIVKAKKRRGVGNILI